VVDSISSFLLHPQQKLLITGEVLKTRNIACIIDRTSIVFHERYI
jgi:hypothetical protein